MEILYLDSSSIWLKTRGHSSANLGFQSLFGLGDDPTSRLLTLAPEEDPETAPKALWLQERPLLTRPQALLTKGRFSIHLALVYCRVL